MMAKHKLAKDITVGDVVIAEDGAELVIKSVTNGIFEGGVTLSHKRGWSDVSRKDKIEIAEREKFQ